MKSNGFKELYDPVREEYKEKTKMQKDSCFYPQQRCVNKYYEKNCDIYAMQLWKKAYPSVDHEKIIENVYGKMQKNIESLPNIDTTTMFHSYYTY